MSSFKSDASLDFSFQTQLTLILYVEKENLCVEKTFSAFFGLWQQVREGQCTDESKESLHCRANVTRCAAVN